MKIAYVHDWDEYGTHYLQRVTISEEENRLLGGVWKTGKNYTCLTPFRMWCADVVLSGRFESETRRILMDRNTVVLVK